MLLFWVMEYNRSMLSARASRIYASPKLDAHTGRWQTTRGPTWVSLNGGVACSMTA
ncbi:hypothetical protein BofuT4_uP111320.1 [Botrytis cinerea T4]|uniref:Uncharacterized protein n=1 Tax=Botryotinia fuckeliana (strain T4) TaxID=999810 RepID=G2Y667_BOTF4|nr:hypothetical protein BofuT4_uP111320.1 [Botrytis cinerea T4]